MRAGPSPSACRSRWQANTIRARSTRLAGSVRERAIETSLAKSSSPIDNSIARRRAVMIFEFRLANQKKQPTGPQRPNESLTKDRFHGIDELVDRFFGTAHIRGIPARQADVYIVGQGIVNEAFGLWRLLGGWLSWRSRRRRWRRWRGCLVAEGTSQPGRAG